MSKHIRHILMRGQRGFTLIELVAVMAILAILVAIVAPAAINSERASVTAQAQADSQSVRDAATAYFNKYNDSEVRIPHSVVTTNKTKVDNATVDGAAASSQQEVSTRWPEMYITEVTLNVPNLATLAGRTANSKHSTIFQTTDDATLVVNNVILKKTSSANVSASDLFTKYTAIDLAKLDDENLLKQMPAGVSETSATGVGSLTAPNFLWLFKKVDSSLGNAGDDRAVVVFTLVKVVQIEGSGATARSTVDLTYQQIVGPTTN